MDGRDGLAQEPIEAIDKKPAVAGAAGSDAYKQVGGRWKSSLDGAPIAANQAAAPAADRPTGWQSSRAMYRADVDGLRAVAILPVVLFHVDVAGFGGGFVGVDVFLVISGYLITSLIQRELDQGTFSFLHFWERRIRRILPALTVVMLLSLIAGWFVLIPADLEKLGESAVAQSLFASNILFWRQSGYFVEAATKPLLHTWSLAVEEQFYLLFPIALFVLSWIGHLARRWLIIAVLLISFALSAWSVATHPAAAFYLLPTRAWELMIGALLALAPGLIHETPAAYRRNEILSWLGLAAIAAAVFGYDSETPFPGPAALLPCLGAAAIIWANRYRLTSVGRLLSTPPLVQIGLISYSLYLWHWPIFAFADYVSLEGLSAFDRCAIILVSIAAAWLSWRLVETPIRRRMFLRTGPRLAVVAISGFALAGVLGLSAELVEGFPSRLPPDALRYADGATDTNPRRHRCHVVSYEPGEPVNPCRLGGAVGGNPVLFVWGDSHADALMPALDAMAGDYSVPAWFRSHSGCPPIQGVFAPRKGNYRCPDFNRAVLRFAKEHGVRHVLLIGKWSAYTEGEENGELTWLIADDQSDASSRRESRAVFKRRFAATIEALLEDGFTVWIVKQVPLQPFSPPARLSQISLYGGDPDSVGRPIEEHNARQAFVNSVLEGIHDERVHLVDLTGLLCSEDGLCRVARNGRSLYRDADHLSRYGSLQMKPGFRALFKTIAEEARQQALDQGGFLFL